jgi:wyosine [tRNA(Phe)-imidazoG37] synthetase (radical SAM superfamily)
MGSSMSDGYKYLFGPVPSRRLGVSLGVDLVQAKTCSLDCVYCESGKTTHLTLNRKPYIPPEMVIGELKKFLSSSPNLDYITFSGSGEPVLNSGIYDVVCFLKENYPEYKTALLTNSTLFYQADVRKDVIDIDLIVASLDAVSPDVFMRINRPVPSLDPDMIISGLIELRKEFNHELWLEIFIVPGVNDTKKELEKLSDAADRIGADRIQINTLDRPGTESWVKPVDNKQRETIDSYFNMCDVVNNASYKGMGEPSSDMCDSEAKILQLVKRRPCTRDDIVSSLGVHKESVEQCLEHLLISHKIRKEIMERGVFYRLF